MLSTQIFLLSGFQLHLARFSRARWMAGDSETT